MGEHNGRAGGQPLLTREILTLAAVFVLGAIMTILDATIVNVALPTLGREFGTSISTWSPEGGSPWSGRPAPGSPPWPRCCSGSPICPAAPPG